MSMAGVYRVVLPVILICMFNGEKLCKMMKSMIILIESAIAGALALRGEQSRLRSFGHNKALKS